jgi:hypothetical protein
VTVEILRKIHAAIGTCGGYEEALLWAAITLAFGAFLRSEEYTQKKVGGVESTPPKMAAIKFVDGNGVAVDMSMSRLLGRLGDGRMSGSVAGMSFFVAKSKTDQMMEGHTVFVAESLEKTLCPVSAMVKFLSMRLRAGVSVNSEEWLFLNKNGKPLQYLEMLGGLRHVLRELGVQPMDYGTHSLRIGAATLAARMGVPDSVIQKMGRWDSTCYLRYIRTSDEDLLKASSSMLGEIGKSTAKKL